MLSRTAEYALRAMAQIATLPPGEAIRASELAAEADVPLAYLSKVLRKLVLAGLLHGEKGHHGGFSLAKPPERIRFSDVLAAAEAAEPVVCAFGWGKCDAADPCPLHPSWSQLKVAYQKWAEGTTLAQVRDSVLAGARERRRRSKRPAR
jgi:Rrf2 family protein